MARMKIEELGDCTRGRDCGDLSFWGVVPQLGVALTQLAVGVDARCLGDERL